MFDIKTFYKTYQVNYYDYVQLTLNSALENVEDRKYQDTILNYDPEDYIRAIKSLIRQTYFHAIETVFDLTFALCPDDNGGIDDALILRRLSKPKFHNKKINEIANSDDGLNFLDEIIDLGKIKITLDHYIFYFGIHNKDKRKPIIQSLQSIRAGLKELAIDLSDTREYNSFKHGLRIIPAVKDFMR